MTTATGDVALYYDELHRWTARDKGFQAFSGFENDTIHRFLIDPDTGTFSPDTLYKYIDPHIATLGPLRGLDAGCGYGGISLPQGARRTLDRRDHFRAAMALCQEHRKGARHGRCDRLSPDVLRRAATGAL
jgi:hypothetical protein